MSGLNPVAFVEPNLELDAWTCPRCGAYAQVIKRQLFYVARLNMPTEVTMTTCTVCRGVVIWWDKARIWPVGLAGPVGHEAMPSDVREIYDEAREVAATSPRSAAALLRVALERLVLQLTPDSKGRLHDRIGELVADGMPRSIQQAMDVVRVVGNNALHPGEIDLNEDPAVVGSLFALVNLVIENRIAQPAEIEAMFKALPDGARTAIDRRDGTG